MNAGPSGPDLLQSSQSTYGYQTKTIRRKNLERCRKRLINNRAGDTLPVLGPCAEIAGVYYATGHYRNGILLAPITGELLAGAIVDKTFPAALQIFSPDRFGLVAVG